MTKTISLLFLTFVLTCSLYAKENFSEMSTQELLSIMGYVKKSELNDFTKELESRLKKMTATEKKIYYQNKEKNK